MQVIATVKSLLSGLSETSESDSNPSRLLRDRNSPQKASPDSILALQILLEVLQVRRGHRVQVLSLVPQAEALEATEDEMEKWRKLGPLGKLYNYVVHIGRTAQRKKQWRAISRGRNIARDNGT